MTQMDFEPEQNYWLQKLADDLVVSGLPLDRRRPVHAVLDRRRPQDAELRRQVVGEPLDDDRVAPEREMIAMRLVRADGDEQSGIVGQDPGDLGRRQLFQPAGPASREGRSHRSD